MKGAGRPAVFLDRDGTVIADADYLADPERLELIPGADDAIRRLREAGLAVVLVTNQSGIARGLYSEADYHAVAARLESVLRAADAAPEGTYFCPHHPDFDGPCDCRKPGTGLYLRAAREHDLDPAASWYVGDKLTDVLPARALGGRGILVRTGYGASHEDALPAGFQVVDDVGAAADLILGEP
ncbi:MAG: HAD family hydrolase [Gemmatimonadetes bacterium]|nr:HAD family hydrolase [Gemmatimonadota bacterium]